ncbi:hypothetical protein [Geomicrobium sediminis]|uniref:Uncharacterized protein n=1 Tax=Geomicrobium sediminis TaxID=1347788 RepID=A0ABS2P7T9_9BACL|nr:hypothetical protein [Geomicrobium sediminis]MBM7631120.1 hypothetical protein [Geomicrobium sediminis]
MKRYVQETVECIDGEDLQKVVIFEEKQKPINFEYVVFLPQLEESR